MPFVRPSKTQSSQIKWLLLHIAVITLFIFIEVGMPFVGGLPQNGIGLYVFHKYDNIYGDAFCISAALLPLLLLSFVFHALRQHWAVIMVSAVISVMCAGVCAYVDYAVLFFGAPDVEHMESVTVGNQVYHLARQSMYDSQRSKFSLCKCDSSGFWCICHYI